MFSAIMVAMLALVKVAPGTLKTTSAGKPVIRKGTVATGLADPGLAKLA